MPSFVFAALPVPNFRDLNVRVYFLIHAPRKAVNQLFIEHLTPRFIRRWDDQFYFCDPALWPHSLPPQGQGHRNHYDIFSFLVEDYPTPKKKSAAYQLELISSQTDIQAAHHPIKRKHLIRVSPNVVGVRWQHCKDHPSCHCSNIAFWQNVQVGFWTPKYKLGRSKTV